MRYGRARAEQRQHLGTDADFGTGSEAGNQAGNEAGIDDGTDAGIDAGFDAVDWAALDHAYGSAEDVPGLLRTAAGAADPEAREEAFDELGSALCHQGSIYSATVAAVPFLARLARRPRTAPRDRLRCLWLLHAAADGSGREYADVRRAVATALPALLGLAADEDPDVRRALVWLITAGGEASVPLLPLLRARLAEERHTDVRADLVTALGLLDVPPPHGSGPAEAWNRALLAGAPEPAVRRAAATELLRTAPLPLPGPLVEAALDAYGAAPGDDGAHPWPAHYRPLPERLLDDPDAALRAVARGLPLAWELTETWRDRERDVLPYLAASAATDGAEGLCRVARVAAALPRSGGTGDLRPGPPPFAASPGRNVPASTSSAAGNDSDTDTRADTHKPQPWPPPFAAPPDGDVPASANPAAGNDGDSGPDTGADTHKPQPWLEPFLVFPDPEIRIAATLAAIRLRVPDAVGLVVRLMEELPEETASLWVTPMTPPGLAVTAVVEEFGAAAEPVARLVAERPCPAWLPALVPFPELTTSCLDALIALLPEASGAVAPLLAGCEAAEPALRARAAAGDLEGATALARLTGDAGPALEAVRAEPEALARRTAAVRVATELGPLAEELLPLVTERLSAPSREGRAAAAAALWRITGRTEDTAPLVAAPLARPYTPHEVQLASLRALRAMRVLPPEAVDVVRTLAWSARRVVSAGPFAGVPHPDVEARRLARELLSAAPRHPDRTSTTHKGR